MKTFEERIKHTPRLENAYKRGLQALSKDCRDKITVSDTYQLQGSADIDTTLQPYYPEANRWDYLVGYRNELHCIELHPACTSDIATILKKLDWLKGWLRGESGGQLYDLRTHYHWIATGSINILPTSSSRKRLAEIGISPAKALKLK